MIHVLRLIRSPLLWLQLQAGLLVGLLVAMPVVGQELRPVSDFYGHYIGHVETGEKREMSVTIKSEGRADFVVSWTTVKHVDGRIKRKNYSIRFQPTRRPGIYSSAMKTNVFGAKTTLDPLEGEPFIWARIKDDTLSVHTLLIMEDGSYEMQIYNRSLNSQGLWLEYSRLNSGEQLKQVSAQLVKVGD